MVAQNLAPTQAGHENASSSSHVLMIGSETIALTTRRKTYDNPEQKTSGGASSSATQPPPTPPTVSNGPLQIERPISDNVLWPPKATIRKVIFNPNA